ncbi:LacI family DNA-binding transcriptional regulator [Bosea sp. (in: a-proteobacteria)]|uniref:LacI family DNA-binding transcriptional regulator n=1 Tax=Bosea sp. (in: a-proteobacteria) TaxID=1871050 RepID=UPI003B3AB3CA
MSLSKLASSLGLSVTTVSRALGGFNDVAEATRRRVLEEAERIGYRPNAMARRLRGGRSDAVGIVLPTGPGQLGEPFFLRLIAAIGPRLAQAGLDLIVSSARGGLEELALYRQFVENRRVDAMIVARTRLDDERVAYLRESGLPFVTHGRTGAGGHASVDIDGAAAFGDATRRLIDFGHRRIGFIGAPLDYGFGFFREAGWREAATQAGLRAGPSRFAEPSEENGFRLAHEILAGPERPTALLCATDRLAVGALHALGDLGLRAVHDVSIIGYDNSPIANYVATPLTSFDPDIEGAASRMLDMLLAQLAGRDGAAMAELRSATLVPRRSDGPAPTDYGHIKSRSISREETSDGERPQHPA